MSACAFTVAYLYRREVLLIVDTSPYSVEGGTGFALSFPIIIYGFWGLVIGIGGLMGAAISIWVAKDAWYKSPAIIASIILLIPFCIGVVDTISRIMR